MFLEESQLCSDRHSSHYSSHDSSEMVTFAAVQPCDGYSSRPVSGNSSFFPENDFGNP